jgi:hypothetical protein
MKKYLEFYANVLSKNLTQESQAAQPESITTINTLDRLGKETNDRQNCTFPTETKPGNVAL